ncbi:hypothetical protein BGZ60DRAFT_407062 [Tricladium varicosporioides]|nr:hypothetical protein BGZ60DRAFT_407062 [Hymenoscyphus varicosporioides]
MLIHPVKVSLCCRCDQVASSCLQIANHISNVVRREFAVVEHGVRSRILRCYRIIWLQSITVVAFGEADCLPHFYTLVAPVGVNRKGKPEGWVEVIRCFTPGTSQGERDLGSAAWTRAFSQCAAQNRRCNCRVHAGQFRCCLELFLGGVGTAIGACQSMRHSDGRPTGVEKLLDG